MQYKYLYNFLFKELIKIVFTKGHTIVHTITLINTKLNCFLPRQPVAQQANNPYLQQLYAAATSPYGQLSPNIMQLMQASTGNPLLDMYVPCHSVPLP